MQSGQLIIRQEFQKFSGTFRVQNKTTNIEDGKLYGDSITFSINGDDFTGHVIGEETLEGVVTSGRITKDWTATRVPLDHALPTHSN